MTTTTMTDAELNRALAERLGVDLTATSAHIFDIVRGSQDGIVFRWAGKEWPYKAIIDSVKLGRYHEPSPQDVWTYRKDKEWQADLEAHVAAWRRDPPNYAGDLVTAFGLGEEVRKRGFERVFARELMRLRHVTHMDVDGAFFAVAHASARERAEAAWLCLEGRERDATN